MKCGGFRGYRGSLSIPIRVCEIDLPRSVGIKATIATIATGHCRSVRRHKTNP